MGRLLLRKDPAAVTHLAPLPYSPLTDLWISTMHPNRVVHRHELVVFAAVSSPRVATRAKVIAQTEQMLQVDQNVDVHSVASTEGCYS